VAITTVYGVPDDGCKGCPKHVELLTPNQEHKKSCISLAFILSVFLKLPYSTESIFGIIIH